MLSTLKKQITRIPIQAQSQQKFIYPKISTLTQQNYLLQSQNKYYGSIFKNLFGGGGKESSTSGNEYPIDFVSELKNGDIRQLKIKLGQTEQEFAVVKHENKIYVLGNFCPHVGAPMHWGQTLGGKIICPYHGAQFDIKTGQLESGPIIDSLPSYEVFEKGGKHFVKLPQQLIQKTKGNLAKKDKANKKRYVIIGAGPAGLSCAMNLRQAGFTGQIELISNEDRVTYDRTALTKALPMGDSEFFALTSEEEIKGADIEFRLGSSATNVDSQKKQVILDDGSSVSYDKLLVATGAAARKLDVPGKDLKNIFTIRSALDYDQCSEVVQEAQNIVIVGGSFIGCEAAAVIKSSLKEASNPNVTLIAIEENPVERVFGKEIGKVMLREHQENGVNCIMQSSVKEYVDDGEGKVGKVILQNGEEIAADVVIVGVGVSPSTSFLKQTAGVKLLKDGSVECDATLKTGDDNIYVAGDLATFASWQPKQDPRRIEHFTVAFDQGAHAALNMINSDINKPTLQYKNVPFFWTRNYEKSLAYVGHCEKPDEIVIQGDTEKKDFIAYFIKNNQLEAVACLGLTYYSNIFVFQEGLLQNVLPSVDELRSKNVDFQALKRKIIEKNNVQCFKIDCCRRTSKDTK